MNYIKNVGDNQNKFGDTATVFQLGLMKDDEVYNFGDNQVTVNIANETGYVLSVTPDKSSQNTVLNLDFNKVPLKNLTPDSYRLEVEVQSTDGDIAKFPTSGAMTFSINHDLKETSGELVPTVTFDNVLAAVDEKIAVYMDTVKVGPQGPQGPTGNVDTSNNNTFTGANKFTQLIDGALKTRPATFTDFADVAANMTVYAGNWSVQNVAIKNDPLGPSGGVFWYEVTVTPAYGTVTGHIEINSVYGSKYYSGVNAGVLTGWYKVANDSTVVHTTGTETIAGNKTFSSPISGRFVSKDVDVTDFNDIAKSMYAHAGIVNIRGTALANGPEPGMTWYTVVVNPSIANDSGSMVAYANDKMFYTGVGSGVVQGWKKLVNDNQVVHNTGTDTISGNKTFTGDNNFSGVTTLKAGNYGLRVTTSGIQKTSDGGTTWTNI